MEELITPELVQISSIPADFKMEFDSIETKNGNWNALNQDVDIGETLLNILDEVRSLKNQFEKSEEENQQLIDTLKIELRQLRTKVRSLNADAVPELHLLPKLPMNTLEELKEFDEKLPQDDELRSELKKFLQRCDSRDYNVFIRDGLRSIVTDELAVNLTWRGTQEKPSVQTFTVFVLLRDICLSKFSNINQFDVNRKFQQHFLHAKDRVSKKKPNQKPPTEKNFATYSTSCRPMTPDLLEPLPSPPSPATNLPKLPFKTLSSLEEFDDQLLENVKLKKSLKQYINRIGGKDAAHFVRAAFRTMMTDEVAKQVTWRGTKEKQSIQEFTIFLIIRDICYAKYPSAISSDVNKACQKHFLYAKDRLKKKSKF